MDPFEMVVLIVAISVGAGVYQTYLKTRANSAPMKRPRPMSPPCAKRSARLKDRVRVLETIVTDKDRALAEEIRKLA
jgi:hypothetical protein